MEYVDRGIALLYHWQTLATGFLAIIAAWIAARPVWRQLRGTESQSNAMLRDILAPRVGELEASRDAALKPGSEAVEKLTAEMTVTDEDVIAEFDEHTAFMLSHFLHGAVREFEAFRVRHIDAPPIEVWKDEVAVVLAHLADRLDDIHRPASTDQTGEDYDFTDDEWAAIKKRAEAARLEVSDKLVEWRTASDRLSEAYDDQLETVKKRILELDRLLLR